VSNHDPYSDWAATSMSMNAASSNRKVCHGWRLSGVLYKFVKPASAKRLHSASQHRMHKVSLLTCAIWTSFAVVTVLKSGRPRLRGGVCPSQVVPSTRQPSFQSPALVAAQCLSARAKSSSARAPLRTLVCGSKRTSVALRSVREPKAGRSRHLYRKGHCGERLDCRRAGSHGVHFRLDGLHSFTNSKKDHDACCRPRSQSFKLVLRLWVAREHAVPAGLGGSALQFRQEKTGAHSSLVRPF